MTFPSCEHGDLCCLFLLEGHQPWWIWTLPLWPCLILITSAKYSHIGCWDFNIWIFRWHSSACNSWLQLCAQNSHIFDFYLCTLYYLWICSIPVINQYCITPQSKGLKSFLQITLKQQWVLLLIETYCISHVIKWGRMDSITLCPANSKDKSTPHPHHSLLLVYVEASIG